MQFIAEVLSFENNKDLLAARIQHHTMDWDGLVMIGSQHLVLPALYCRFKEKGLLPLLPEDLRQYLKEITDINRGRNEILLQEAHDISELFNKSEIDHVFIKGMALIGGQVFKDPAERMIGDMDLLVAPHQIDRAFSLLTRYGYTETISYIIERKNHRHLPRQISKEKYGAVELHRNVLKHRYRTLISTTEILKNKRIIDGIAIPNIPDSNRIAILIQQINDKAHTKGFINFRTLYDCLALKLPENQILVQALYTNKYTRSFLQLSGIFFKELRPLKTSQQSRFRKAYFIFGLRHPKWKFLLQMPIKVVRAIYLRVVLISTNKSYRQHILKNKILKIKE